MHPYGYPSSQAASNPFAGRDWPEKLALNRRDGANILRITDALLQQFDMNLPKAYDADELQRISPTPYEYQLMQKAADEFQQRQQAMHGRLDEEHCARWVAVPLLLAFDCRLQMLDRSLNTDRLINCLAVDNITPEFFSFVQDELKCAKLANFIARAASGWLQAEERLQSQTQAAPATPPKRFYPGL